MPLSTACTNTGELVPCNMEVVVQGGAQEQCSTPFSEQQSIQQTQFSTIPTQGPAMIGIHNNHSSSNERNNHFWSVSDAASHKWCMPDEASLPRSLDFSQPRSENSSWGGGGGRLKVKSSIGGVSVQDLSSAVVQNIE